MTAGSSTLSLSGLPIGFEATGADALLELFRKERDPDLWHLCVTKMNPDTGAVYSLGTWLIKQPDVDRATVMFLLNMFYWGVERNGEQIYPVYAGDNNHEREAFDLAIDRLRRDDFSRAELNTPRLFKANEVEARDFEPKVLLNGQSGREPKTPWKVFDEQAVLYDPHDTIISKYAMY
ncbi:hypothetical protein [Ruegeria arenilitoris]|uniref:hypothetical protein n=1 Tax=Ruegeria arenilitoris TaxID=1173585 RepID=UPI001CFCF79E|nr:hypothetical protein [Ruegeria arenilitoris]